MQQRRQPETGFVVHYNATAPPVPSCEAFDTICGVSSWMLDRWATSAWERVTCGRCRRSIAHSFAQMEKAR